MKRFPVQPIETDSGGVLRFRENKVAQALLSASQSRGFGLNELARMDLPQEDWEQFAQLTGYSLSGFADLSYVSDDTFAVAEAMSTNEVSEEAARICVLSDKLELVRAKLRELIPELFRIHPDDLVAQGALRVGRDRDEHTRSA